MGNRLPEYIVCSVQDYENKTVYLDVDHRDHIIEHVSMRNNFNAIYDTVSYPDIVNKDKDFDDRKVFYKVSAGADYEPKFATKAVVEYYSDNTGWIITSYPVPRRKMGVSDGEQIYP